MNKYTALIILVPCAILHSMGMDIFVSGLPEMMSALGSNEQSIQYLLIAFMVGTGVGQPFAGILCDRYGRRRMMLAATALFVASTLPAGLLHSVLFLSVLRFFSGMAASGALVATYAIINDEFDDKDAYRMFSFLGCSTALAPMLAPILGVSLIYLFNGWQACFYFLALFSFMAFISTYKFLPETKTSDTIAPSLRMVRTAYMSMFRNRQFMTYCFAAIAALSQLFLFFSVGNILLIKHFGLSQSAFSFAFGFNAIIFLLGNYFSTKLQKKLLVHDLIKISAFCMIAGSITMGYFSYIQASTAFNIVLTNALMTFGVGLMMGPATGAALQPFKQFAGVASGLFAVMQYLGAASVGFIVTRFTIHSALSIALPILGLSVMILIVLKFTVRNNTFTSAYSTID